MLISSTMNARYPVTSLVLYINIYPHKDSINNHKIIFLNSAKNYSKCIILAGTLPANGLYLHLAGVTMASAIDELALPESRRYVVGNGAQVLYYTTGTSRDWTRAVGIPLTYTMELPGFTYGFLVPPTYIKQIVTETWAGFAAGGHFVLNSL